VLTESPHRSLAYPSDTSRMESPALQRLWEVSSPLLEAEKLVARHRTLCAQSRGMVVNGKFDLLVEMIAAYVRFA